MLVTTSYFVLRISYFVIRNSYFVFREIKIHPHASKQKAPSSAPDRAFSAVRALKLNHGGLQKFGAYEPVAQNPFCHPAMRPNVKQYAKKAVFPGFRIKLPFEAAPTKCGAARREHQFSLRVFKNP